MQRICLSFEIAVVMCQFKGQHRGDFFARHLLFYVAIAKSIFFTTQRVFNCGVAAIILHRATRSRATGRARQE